MSHVKNELFRISLGRNEASNLQRYIKNVQATDLSLFFLILTPAFRKACLLKRGRNLGFL